MKKTLFSVLAAAVLGFAACGSEDELNVSHTQRGMVLRAAVEQPAATRATFTDGWGIWRFAFDMGDNVSVTNPEITGCYFFTNKGADFRCGDAEPTSESATWYAYFPSDRISLVGQSGKMEDAADLYALAGATVEDTDGKDGLSITMSPKVAFLVIENQKGAIGINVKTSATDWVSGLTANADNFTVTTATSKQTLLSATDTGTYYVAVPAGVQLAVKDGDRVIKSTGESGLTAGSYYYLSVYDPAATTGTAWRRGSDACVKWVQLWADGPKFAEYNVGAASATETGREMTFTDAAKGGSDYVWGTNWCTPSKEEMDELLNAATIEGSEKVSCEYDQVGGRWGFIFTGKEKGYTGNTVFFPIANGHPEDGHAGYWSCTADDGRGWHLYLQHMGDNWFSKWELQSQDYWCLLRPVLRDN